MSWLPALPILIPLITAAVLILLRKSILQKYASIFGSSATILVSLIVVLTVDKGGTLVTQAGGWAAPFGISLVVDRVSAILVFITAILVSACLFYSQEKYQQKNIGKDFYPFFRSFN